MDDEYIPPYADDPKLMELRSKVDIIRACARASNNAGDTEALGALLTAHPNATQLYPEVELLQIIRNSRNQREDFSAQEDLEYRHFTLTQAIDTRIAELGFEELYRPLMDASPVKLSGLTRSDFLAALFPRGTSVLMLDSSRAREGLPWSTERPKDFELPWYLPLPVHEPEEEGEWVEKSKRSVAAWTSATANFDDGTLELIRPLIMNREIPVRVVMSTNAGTTVVFALDAPNEAEWRKKCRALKARIEALGGSCPSFRYNWVAPMIHTPFTRLVYFCPRPEIFPPPQNNPCANRHRICLTILNDYIRMVSWRPSDLETDYRD